MGQECDGEGDDECNDDDMNEWRPKMEAGLSIQVSELLAFFPYVGIVKWRDPSIKIEIFYGVMNIFY